MLVRMLHANAESRVKRPWQKKKAFAAMAPDR
jgi:hypothetical protein